jgi:hypothetical protein
VDDPSEEEVEGRGCHAHMSKTENGERIRIYSRRIVPDPTIIVVSAFPVLLASLLIP